MSNIGDVQQIVAGESGSKRRGWQRPIPAFRGIIFPTTSGGLQTIPGDGTPTPIIFGTPSIDTEGMWSGGAGDTLTAQADGYYEGTLTVNGQPGHGDFNVGFMAHSSAETIAQASGVDFCGGTTPGVFLNAGDTFKFFIQQSFGGVPHDFYVVGATLKFLGA